MSDDQDIFDFPFKLLIYMGLWSFEGGNPIIRKLYWIYQSWWLLYVFFFLGFCICDLIKYIHDVQRSSTNLSLTITVFMLVWKNSVALKNYRRIQSLRKELRDGLHPKDDPVDEQIKLDSEKNMKFSCIILYVMSAITVTFWLMSPVLVKSKKEETELPLPVYIPWDLSKSVSFALGYLYQGMGAYFVAFDLISLNLVIFGTILILCSEYNVLMKNTRKINTWCRNFCWKSEKVRQLTEKENFHVHKMIVDNIRHHQKIIRCIDEAEKSFVHMMLVQFAGSTCLVTVVSLDLILVTIHLNSRLITLITFLNLVSVDISLFCFFGSKLISKSQEFLNCMYELPWNSLNSQNRRMISLVILKAQRAPKLTIEKVASIDLYTLLRVIKVIYNFLYLLLHLAGKKGN